MHPQMLHVAVWDGDEEALQRMLKQLKAQGATIQSEAIEDVGNVAKSDALTPLQRALETRDAHGYTPLHLAVRIAQPNQRRIVQLLLDYGASVQTRCNEGWNCLQDATLCDDEYLLAQIFVAGEKVTYREYENRLEDIFDALEKLPDFEAEIFVEARSWVPGVSKMLPSDTLLVRKKASSLRCDYSLQGLEGIKWKRSQSSQIFCGRNDLLHAGHVFLVNHDAKTKYDVTRAYINPTPMHIDSALQLLLTAQLSCTSVKSEKLAFKKRKQMVAPSKKCPWSGTKYLMENLTVQMSFRPPAQPKRMKKTHQQGAEANLENFRHFVKHLAKKNNPKLTKSNSSSQEDEQASQAPSKHAYQTATLVKGKSMEMHLDVMNQDTIQWDFTASSTNYTFKAEYIFESQRQQICSTQGVKKTPIKGIFEVPHAGNFILTWTNTQKAMNPFDTKVKVQFQVIHARVEAPAAMAAAPSASLTDTSPSRPVAVEVDQEKPDASSDWENCSLFDDPHHRPNPKTITTDFKDFFDASKLEMSVNSSVRNQYRSMILQPYATKRLEKSFDAKVFIADADSFPFNAQHFAYVMEFISKTTEYSKNLNEFLNLKLPQGFPVKFELPVMLTVRMAYTFRRIQLTEQLPQEIFAIPQAYTQIETLTA